MTWHTKISRIAVINLRSRPDRLRHVRAVLRGPLGIPPDAPQLRYYLVDKDPRGSQLGCMLSHLRVIDDAIRDNLPEILIFEDDIRTTAFYDETIMNAACDFIFDRRNKSWEIFQLGYLPSFPSHEWARAARVAPNILRFTGVFTQAYCLSARGMRVLSKTIHDVIDDPRMMRAYATPGPHRTMLHFDYLIVQPLFRKRGTGYCVTPVQIDQDFCQSSDNSSLPSSLHGAAEVALRSLACPAQRIEASAVVSALPNRFVHSWALYGFMGVSLLVVLVILLILRTIKNI